MPLLVRNSAAELPQSPLAAAKRALVRSAPKPRLLSFGLRRQLEGETRYFLVSLLRKDGNAFKLAALDCTTLRTSTMSVDEKVLVDASMDAENQPRLDALTTEQAGNVEQYLKDQLRVTESPSASDAEFTLSLDPASENEGNGHKDTVTASPAIQGAADTCDSDGVGTLDEDFHMLPADEFEAREMVRRMQEQGKQILHQSMVDFKASGGP